MRWRPAPTPTWASPARPSGPCGWPRTPSATPRLDGEPEPDWIRFFSEAELNGENAHSYRDLAYVAGRSPTYASLAEPVMERAVDLFGKDEEHQRSYALNLIGMATVHLLKREPEQSHRAGRAGPAGSPSGSAPSGSTPGCARPSTPPPATSSDVAEVVRMTDLLTRELPETAEAV